MQLQKETVAQVQREGMCQSSHRMLRNCDGHLRRLGHYCGTTGEPVLLRRPRRFTSGRSAGKPGPPIGRPKISRRLIGRLPVTSYLAADTFDFSRALPPSSSLGDQQGGSLGHVGHEGECNANVRHLSPRCLATAGGTSGRDKCSAFLR